MRVYEDPSIISHFDKRAWVVVSQHHNESQMLKCLLNSIGNARSGNDEDQSIVSAGSDNNEDLAIRLYQGLKGLRYLIVMDDVWSREAWDAIKACFPDDINGSRVLLTTRLAEVSNHTCSEDYFSHQMHLLESSESWNLFCENACKSHCAQYESIGRRIVDKCKGLPLAIIVVAGLVSKLNTLDEWKNIANALNSSSATTLNDDECWRILSLSYNHLTNNLKACFLYLGVFPEDHEFNANDLARLWFAEGLVKAFENESFDAVANRYIQELMDRNLIILSKLSSCGRKFKRFRVHDLLHAFCAREAQNERLLHIVMSENSFDFSQKGFRWVSIQSVNFNMSTIRSRSKSCRSFFYFLSEESSFNFKNFDLLRILYSSTEVSRLKEIVDTVHLRFLNSWPRKNMELFRVWNLQTLDFKSPYIGDDLRGNYSEFPQLQYICSGSFYGNPPRYVHKLSWVRADFCSKEYIMNIPYLKKIHIDGKSSDCNDCITNLAYLEQLEGLHIFGNGKQIPINNDILLLENLRKLSFRHIGFEWEEINVLSMLPRLEVLKLEWISCLGVEWEIPDEVIFLQLICLYIHESDFKYWKASSQNFPKLERLLLSSCRTLREIPMGFADISTLKSILLLECLPSAVESAKKIQDEQHDYGNYNMVLIEEYTLMASEYEESLSDEESEVDN